MPEVPRSEPMAAAASPEKATAASPEKAASDSADALTEAPATPKFEPAQEEEEKGQAEASPAEAEEKAPAEASPAEPGEKAPAEASPAEAEEKAKAEASPAEAEEKAAPAVELPSNKKLREEIRAALDENELESMTIGKMRRALEQRLGHEEGALDVHKEKVNELAKTVIQARFQLQQDWIGEWKVTWPNGMKMVTKVAPNGTFELQGKVYFLNLEGSEPAIAWPDGKTKQTVAEEAEGKVTWTTSPQPRIIVWTRRTLPKEPAPTLPKEKSQEEIEDEQARAEEEKRLAREEAKRAWALKEQAQKEERRKFLKEEAAAAKAKKEALETLAEKAKAEREARTAELTRRLLARPSPASEEMRKGKAEQKSLRKIKQKKLTGSGQKTLMLTVRATVPGRDLPAWVADVDAQATVKTTALAWARCKLNVQYKEIPEEARVFGSLDRDQLSWSAKLAEVRKDLPVKDGRLCITLAWPKPPEPEPVPKAAPAAAPAAGAAAAKGRSGASKETSGGSSGGGDPPAPTAAADADATEESQGDAKGEKGEGEVAAAASAEGDSSPTRKRAASGENLEAPAAKRPNSASGADGGDASESDEGEPMALDAEALLKEAMKDSDDENEKKEEVATASEKKDDNSKVENDNDNEEKQFWEGLEG